MLATRMRMAASAGAAGGNWWEAGGASGAVAVYQPKGAASLAASYTDLSGNSNNYSPSSAPSLVANGWEFTGSEYGDVGGVVPDDQDWTYIVWVVSWDTNSWLFGRTDSGAEVGLRQNGAVRNGGSLDVPNFSSGEATYAIAGPDLYIDGVDQSVAIGDYTATSTDTLVIGRKGDYPFAVFDGVIAAFAAYNKTLSAAEVAAVSTAMAAL